MDCTHEQIKSVNCELFCLKCGEKLPADFLTDKISPAPKKTAETPAEPKKEAPKATKKSTTRKGGK